MRLADDVLQGLEWQTLANCFKELTQNVPRPPALFRTGCSPSVLAASYRGWLINNGTELSVSLFGFGVCCGR